MANQPIKAINDIPSSGISVGQIGEMIRPLESVAGKYHVRFPLEEDKGWISTNLTESIDFVFIEGDYSDCLCNRREKEFKAFTFERTIQLDKGSHTRSCND